MLSAMRTGAKSNVVKVLLFGPLVLAAIGLAVIDRQGFLRDGIHNSYVAKIGREKITSSEFDHVLQRALQQQNLPQDEAYRTGVPMQVLDQEINSRIFGRAARDNGVIIDDKSAAAQLKSLLAPAAKQAGITEQEAFKRMLQNSGANESFFVSTIKGQMATDTLLKTLAAPARAPQQMVDDALKYSAEWRRGEYFTLTAADAPAVGTPSEDDLKTYYQAIASQFSLPEYRDFSVLLLDKAALTGKADEKPTEEAMKKHYDDNIAAYSTPERRTVGQVVVAYEALAKQIHDRAATTKDLKKAAEEIAKGKANYIHDTYAKADMPVELADAVFKTEKGSVSDPVKSPLGWHVLYIENVTPGAATPFEKAKAQITKEMSEGDNADAMYDRANEVDDMVAGGKSLADVAAKYGLKEVVFNDVSSEGVDKKGAKVVSTLPVFPKIVQTAFSLDQGEASQLIETPEGSFVLVEVRGIKPPQEQPLEAVRSEVLEGWKQKKKGELLDQQATKITEKLQLGESFDKVAAGLGKKVESTGLIQRSTPPAKSGLDRGLLPAALRHGQARPDHQRGRRGQSHHPASDRAQGRPAQGPQDRRNRRDAVHAEPLPAKRRA